MTPRDDTASVGMARASARLIARIDGLPVLRGVYGPAAAEEALAEVERRLTAAARAESAEMRRTGRGVYALTVDVESTQELARLADRLQTAVGDTSIATGAGPVVATLSVGAVVGAPAETSGASPPSGASVSLLQPDAPDVVRRLSRQAMRAAARAEERAPAGLCVTPAREIPAPEAVETGRSTLAALREGRFALAYQPVIRADDPRAVAFSECLARLLEPSGRPVLAGAFMPALEELRLTRLIDRRVLALALEDLAALPTLRLSVNLSAHSLGDPGWLRILGESEADRPGLAQRLIVEVTESALIVDEARAAGFIARVRRFGCAVALDDFGAGFSAFRHFKLLRPDILKIDANFAEGVGTDPDNRALVESLLVAARHFEMMTVAERVNDPADQATLRRLGVDAFQGDSFGAPTIEPGWRVPWDSRAAI